MAHFQLCQSREFPGFNVVDLLCRGLFPSRRRPLELMEVDLNIPPFARGETGKSLLDFDDAHWSETWRWPRSGQASQRIAA